MESGHAVFAVRPQGERLLGGIFRIVRRAALSREEIRQAHESVGGVQLHIGLVHQMGVLMLDKVQKLLQGHVTVDGVNVCIIIEVFRIRPLSVSLELARKRHPVIFVNVPEIIKAVSPLVGVADLCDGIDVDVLPEHLLGAGLHFVLHQKNLVGGDTRILVIFLIEKDGGRHPDGVFLVVPDLKTALHIVHESVVFLLRLRPESADGLGELRMKL